MRRLIPLPRFKREITAADLELDIHRQLRRYYELAPAARVAFFLSNLISEARLRGRLLPPPERKHEPQP